MDGVLIWDGLSTAEVVELGIGGFPEHRFAPADRKMGLFMHFLRALDLGSGDDGFKNIGDSGVLAACRWWLCGCGGGLVVFGSPI